jgi:hypothetical protein
MTPENSNPSKPPLVESWEAGADDRDTDKIFAWDFYCAAEERSLDRMHERHLRENAATRAVMNLKHRLLDDGIWIRPTAGELFLMERLAHLGRNRARPREGREAQSPRRRL